MFLLAVTCTSTLHINCKLLAPLHVWFCIKYVFVCVESYLPILCIQVCLFDSSYTCVLFLNLMHLDDILFGSL